MHAFLQSNRLRQARATTRKSGLPTRSASLIALLSTFLLVSNTHAFDDLNEAQTLIYEHAHLANTAADDVLIYRYRATYDGSATIDDEATLRVSAETDAERRDVTLNFLSDERELNLPTFHGYRGNPVVIAMLEHLAQTMSADTGGGALYFRNRIRDGMASAEATVEHSDTEFDGKRVEMTSVVFHPFRDDAFLGNRPGYGDARFEIRFSDTVPGGVLAVVATAAAAEATAETGAILETSLSLADFQYELLLNKPGE